MKKKKISFFQEDYLCLSHCKCNQFKEEVDQSHGISIILQRYYVTYQDIFQDQYCQKDTKIAYLREIAKSIASVGLNHVTDMSQDDMDVVGNIGLEVSLDVQHCFFAKVAKFLDFDLLPL